jgi:hypothetical protein
LCDESADLCNAPDNTFCDDGMFCTENDACIGSGGDINGCSYSPKDSICLLGFPDCISATCDANLGCINYLPVDCTTTGIPSEYISYWKFEGNTNDEKGRNDGTLMDNAAIISDSVRGSVLSLDGAGDYVDVPNDASLNISGPLTISAWIKNENDKDSYQDIVAKGRGFDTGGAYSLAWLGSNDNAYFFLRNPTNDGYVNARTSLPYDNNWHHVAAVYNGTNGIVYVDGSSAGGMISATVSPIWQNNKNVLIGGSMWFKGSIDDVMIFNKSLSEEEVQKIYCLWGKGESFCDYSLNKFSMIVLPDTQYYTETYPWIFTNQTQWIVDNSDELNTKFVLHLGDVVNSGTNLAHYDNANTSLSILDGKVNYSLTIGNHDYNSLSIKDTTNWENYFGLSRYGSLAYWGGQRDAAEGNINTYQYFTVDGREFMVLNLEFCPRDEVLAWANQTVENNPDKKVIVVTHGYMNYDDTRLSSGDQYSCEYYSSFQESTNNGEQQWDKFVKWQDNIFMVQSGHILGDGTGYLKSTGINGNEVHQILSNYQRVGAGGDGWLRIYEFSPDKNKIYVKTYSPYLDLYNYGSENEFTLDYDFDGAGVTTLSPFAKIWNFLKGFLTKETGNVITGGVVNEKVYSESFNEEESFFWKIVRWFKDNW